MISLVERTRKQLYLASGICKTYSGQTSGMQAEVTRVEKMLRDATFYELVTNREIAASPRYVYISNQATFHIIPTSQQSLVRVHFLIMFAYLDQLSSFCMRHTSSFNIFA